MYPVIQNSTNRPLSFLMVLSSDHITGATGLVPTVTLGKNGAAFVPAQGAVSEVGNGWYEVAPNTADNAVLGPLLLHATAATADPTDESFVVIPQPALPPGGGFLPGVGSQYITPADLGSFYDQRRVLQLAVDSTTPANPSDLTNPSSIAYQICTQAILSAASDIDTHCNVGQRYAPSDLANLISNWQSNPTNQQYAKSAALLRQLCADLAYGFLACRRGYAGDSLKQFSPRFEPALVTLERLAEGLQIFNVDSAIAASVPQVRPIAGGVTRPSQWCKLFGVGPIGDPYSPPNRGGPW